MAAFVDVAPRLREVARVPRVVYITRMEGEIKQAVQLAIGVAAEQAVHVAHVGSVHTEDEVEAVVVIGGKLASRVVGVGDAVEGKFAKCLRIDRVAKLLGAGGSGVYGEKMGQASLLHEVLHGELGHRTAADVAVADKEEVHCRYMR